MSPPAVLRGREWGARVRAPPAWQGNLHASRARRSSAIPLVGALEVPEQVDDEEGAGGEVVAVAVVGQHEEARGALAVRDDAGEVGDGGDQVDEEAQH